MKCRSCGKDICRVGGPQDQPTYVEYPIRVLREDGRGGVVMGGVLHDPRRCTRGLRNSAMEQQLRKAMRR